MEMDWGKDLRRGLGKRKRNGEGTSLGEEAIPEDSSCCPPLLPKHKIFLSHSGKQKWFVEKLCEDLEAHHRFPFFDKRPSSLPMGERFPKLILEAAERCEMAVVVVSEEFLMSKWPMMELSTFVQALSGSNPGLKILPLFFGMSVSDLGSPSRQAAWLEEWNKWESEDARLKSADLKEALKVMRSCTGMVLNGDMDNVWSFERDVVKSICKVVGANVKWEDSHVQGRSSICEATREKIKEMEPCENGICVFGYYGMGGIGKTTMCKILCNELSEFSGKVCHIELGGTQNVEQMLKEVLKKLTNTSEELLQKLNEDECKCILKSCSSWRERSFLVIDNVWGDNKSMEQAEMFLKELAFYEGSVVMMTSRCQSTLVHVGVKEAYCFEVPELGKEDARKLFLHHAANGKQFANVEDNRVIEECIARCWFWKSETLGCHYLPLALKVLGVHLRRFGPSPAEWLVRLPEVRDFNCFEGDNPVFSIIRLNYDRLSVQLQALFMDVAVFRQASRMEGFWHGEYLLNYFGELSLVHRQKLEDTRSQLQQLKERGLLEDVDMESGRVSLHDLFKEFAKLEARGKLDSYDDFSTRKWVYDLGLFPSDLERTPFGGCWQNLTRVYLDMKYYDGVVLNLQQIQWRYFLNLILLCLKLWGKVKGVLNLEGLRCLRSLYLEGGHSIDGVDGLKDLNNLTNFHWCGKDRRYVQGMISYNCFSRLVFLGQLPTSLKFLNLCHIYVCLRNDRFECCTTLLEVSFVGVKASGCIDFRQCTCLQSVNLMSVMGMETLLFLPMECLRVLQITKCYDLGHVIGLSDLDCLHLLKVKDNPLLEVLNFNRLKHLHNLSLSRCKKLAHLEGVEGLTDLQCVDLSECSPLLQLPDLSNLTKLESLYLSESGIELHENDIDMLAMLPGLSLVRIGNYTMYNVDLDLVRRKVVIRRQDMKSGWVGERELGTLPIKLRYYQREVDYYILMSLCGSTTLYRSNARLVL